MLRVHADSVVRNGIVIPMDGRKVLIDASIVIDKDRIVAVGSTSGLDERYGGKRTINAKGAIVLPGFVNTHTLMSSESPNDICTMKLMGAGEIGRAGFKDNCKIPREQRHQPNS